MWDEALCRDGGRLFPEADWFPERENSKAGRAAIKVCRHCPVAAACLDSALRGEKTELDRIGIFGGMTADDRRAAWSTPRPGGGGWTYRGDNGRGDRWLDEIILDGLTAPEIGKREKVDKSLVYKLVKKARAARAEGCVKTRQDDAWGKVNLRERATQWLDEHEAGTPMATLAMWAQVNEVVVARAIARARLVRDVA